MHNDVVLTSSRNGTQHKKKDALEQQRLCFEMKGGRRLCVLRVRTIKHWKKLPQWLLQSGTFKEVDN